ncbi:MAG: carboxylesterase/lipase family protein [Acidobacteria bacterium]|nr:carboxylesterase/lipase family protein [Acidobacteriota bacterium]
MNQSRISFAAALRETRVRRRELLQHGLGAAALLSSRSVFAWVTPESRPVVRTTAGDVRGTIRGGLAGFLGIPYGADTKARRFQPAIPVAPWKGIRDTTAWGDRSPQLGGGRARREETHTNAETYHLPPDEGEISEDCLHLNVWTPSPSRAGHERRPVLFYIHGGAYNSGTVNASLYDGTRLARRGDAVVVTVNHRLNAFGFLYLAELTDDPAYADSGNVGMLDLVLALRWVRDNIAAFGGDPNRVTIWGQSGGGAKCATLMAMPAAHGLFHRVMSMSGQQVTVAPKKIATERTRAFLAKLDLDRVPGSDLRQKLDALPLDALEEAARVSSAWLPVVDGGALPRDPFEPDAPPLSADVPMILGNTHDETRGLIGGAQPALFSLTWEEVPAALTKNVGSFLGGIDPEDVVAKYRHWYPQYSPSDVFFAAATAFRSWPGQVIEAERRAQSPAASRTWVYQMNWPSPVAGGKFGAPHTLDIPFYFDNLALAPGMVGAAADDVRRAQPLADAMSETLLAYAKTGNPNNPAIPQWPAYDLSKRFTMAWGNKPAVVSDPRGEERKLGAQAHYRQPGT